MRARTPALAAAGAARSPPARPPARPAPRTHAAAPGETAEVLHYSNIRYSEDEVLNDREPPKFMNHPAPANSRYKPTCYEHAANCYTHAFLIFPAIVGSALLHRLSDDRWEKITAWMYGMGLCALFIVSTVFHIVSWKKSHLRTMEHCFHMCDRMVIYVFIAASYAPWLNLRELGPLASHMRWFIWLMAAGGTIYVFLYHEKYKIVELLFYLAMGFSPALVVISMNNTDGLQEVAWGGLIYCMGVVFFKSDGIIPFAHAIWHMFVAIAAAVHYYAIWKYLYRSPADIIRHL
ncbi:monocyte to macrophage differentiation factor isoform X2 [Lepidochelys kempii]|uniref:monocyte to macrophage differentiation factor isoform X2 n=1 Tax=Caretta caretta TaxID=8467 RepID=UPI002094292E|nr:monocyte to macrophage differentiation factor isoform X1 [Caretta caretta]